MTDFSSRRRALSLLAGVALAGVATSASAQGFFDFFRSRPAPPPPMVLPEEEPAPRRKPRPKPKPRPKASANDMPPAKPAAPIVPEQTPIVPSNPGNLRIGVIVPSQDDPFYRAAIQGIQEAAAALGSADVVVAAPRSGTAAGQSSLVNGFIKQKVDALIIAPMDPRVVGPAARRAMAWRIKVVSFGKPLPAGTRMAHIDNAATQTGVPAIMGILAGDVRDGGDVAILAGARNGSEGQALVSRTMQEWLKPSYGKLKLAATLYGNDDEKSGYEAAQKALTDHSALKGLVVFNKDALAGAARAVQDKGLAGKVFVTGFGQPSLLKAAVAAKIVDGIASINPVDAGYAAIEIASALAKNETKADAGSSVNAGRLGQLTLGRNGLVTLPPFTVDARNFDQFMNVY